MSRKRRQKRDQKRARPPAAQSQNLAPSASLRHRSAVAWLGIAGLVLLAAWGWFHLRRPPLSIKDRAISNTSVSAPITLPTLPARETSVSVKEISWQSETLHKATEVQLKRLAKWLEEAVTSPQDELEAIVAPDFASGPIRPTELTTVFDDGTLRVLRGADSSEDSEIFQGAAGLAMALRNLAEAWDSLPDVHVKFKQFRIETLSENEDAREVATTAYLQADAKGDQSSAQVRATWDFRWQRDDATGQMRLRSLRARQHEETTVLSDQGTLFSDCTEAVLQNTAAYHRELVYGMDHWLGRRQYRFGVTYHGHHGLAIGDVNGDGLEDVYLCQMAGLPNRLFLQNADGTVREKSAESRVDILDSTRSALFVDLDNDGDQDLVVAMSIGLLILSNDGQGVFTLETLEKAMADVQGGMSLAAADYDNDRDLDIYVCNYNLPYVDTATKSLPIPYHDANNGMANTLLRNDGSWNFTDVTEAVGLDENNQRYSFAAAWEDFDNDGDLDLYVANDFGRNNLYRNDGGSFRDVAAEAGVEDISAGMSVTWGDYNHDGLMDLYVSNMFSSAGNRVTYQRQFKPAAGNDTRAAFQRHARGNSLFENAGDGTFRDVSDDAGVTMGRWAWASLFVDINNDSYEDLLVANGLRTGEDTGDL